MLSGGQRKRVGLTQVLIRDPKILLMDEPFGPLDAQTRQIMGNLLLDLWSADRKAVMFVTHDLEEAIALSDRVVIMSAGPAARIIGNWTVPLARPRDIGEVKLDPAFHKLHREIWEALKDEVMKGYAADGGRVIMSRSSLHMRYARCAPSPVCGGGLGRGHICSVLALKSPSLALPRKRGREYTECGERQTGRGARS